MNIGRLMAMARKEAIQLRRDTRSLILAFLLPVILLIIFGYAISWDVRNIKTAVLDQDQSAQSRELLEAFRSSGYFTFQRQLRSASGIAPLLDGVSVQLVLVIPPDFSSNLNAGRSAELQAIVDGSDANTATIILNYARAIVQTHSLKVQFQGRQVTPPLRAETRVWFNEELESRNMIVPGLVAMIMMIVSAMLTATTIAREWERGTMEQLAATPVSRAEVILGKMLPYIAIGLIDMVGVSLLGKFLFDVPFRGNPALFMVLSFFFLIGALGLGIVFSVLGRSQLLATQVAMLATFLPAVLLSGFMYAITVMPKPLQLITYLVPARYFLVVTRGIFLKGVGVEVLYVQGLLMILFAAIGLFLAVRVFKKELV